MNSIALTSIISLYKNAVFADRYPPSALSCASSYFIISLNVGNLERNAAWITFDTLSSSSSSKASIVLVCKSYENNVD